jgi:membrane carboxypeptidase/penicillin-binding protein
MRGKARLILRIGLVLTAIVVLYLGVAAAWAYSVTPEVVMRASSPRLIDLRSLPKPTVDILLRVEDPTFREHHGVDPFARGQGFATLTSSLVKRVYLNGVRLSGFTGVLQRMYRFADRVAGPVDFAPDVMALVVDRRLGKTRQIELFLQHVYMGRHGKRQLYGLPDASRAYYHKEPRQLSYRELVTLVAMIVAPNQFHPVRNPTELAERTRRIERLLRGGCQPRGMRDVYYPDCARKAQ